MHVLYNVSIILYRCADVTSRKLDKHEYSLIHVNDSRYYFPTACLPKIQELATGANNMDKVEKFFTMKLGKHCKISDIT